MASCKVMLIGAYDQGTDMAIQKVQTEVSTILVKLETCIENGDTTNVTYKNFTKSYEEIKVDLECLKVRTGAIPKYKVVQDQVNLMYANILNFEKAHKMGNTSAKEIKTYKSTFEIGFGAMIQLQNALKREKK